jgi:hypothetical protein
MTRAERGLWKDLPRRERRECRRQLRALRARFGPLRGVALDWAKLTVETWATTGWASEAALAAGLKRRNGTGRRPNQQAVNRLYKRQGLGVGTLGQMLDRLERLNTPRAKAASDVFGGKA